MKSYNKIIFAAFVLTIMIFVAANTCMLSYGTYIGRYYRVEANRIAHEIEKKGASNIDMSDYSMVTGVYALKEGDRAAFFDTESDYLIRQIGNETYRIEYTPPSCRMPENMVITINLLLLLMAAVMTGFLIFIRQEIIKPFHQLHDVPYELAKGNLNIPIRENRGMFFGKFTWGMDLLRENIEQQKQRELDLQKEKKTLVLSISHDIKTPLSAIKLYSKALSKGLYTDRENLSGIALNIDRRADEIQDFVSEIIKASSEDFLNLTVKPGEFYLSGLVGKVSKYYGEKLELVKIPFSVGAYSDCLIRGDLDRGIEVLQNIIENAIKYGDGHGIELSFREEEDCQLLSVRNSGCSLPATELPHIFDSFWRGSNTGNERGSGLGLYICRQLMHRMDGEIFAEITDEIMCVTVVFRNA